jgi:hypothetical protein
MNTSEDRNKIIGFPRKVLIRYKLILERISIEQVNKFAILACPA